MADDFEVFAMIGRGGSCTPAESPNSSRDNSPPQKPESHHSSLKQKNSADRLLNAEISMAQRQLDRLEVEVPRRNRANSLPTSEGVTRVRTFETAASGMLQRRADYVKSSSSITSTGSDFAEPPPPTPVDKSNVYRILLLGGEGVGKTALTHQFLTSEDVSDTDYFDDGKEKYCTVSVNGEESFIIFMDSDYDKNNYDPSSANAYIVVYSCTDRESFTEAKELLKNLRHFEKDKAIILCGNKSDLVRRRKVSTEEGCSLAGLFEAEFIETSTTLNHRVDNLLVGIVSQIKSQIARRKKKSSGKKKVKRRTMTMDLRKSVKGIVDKIVHRTGSSSRKSPDTSF